ncbi:MAG: hypothetical protein HQL36_02445 [Alphaproteobacteria bacterium]|nr:hypothetical protein [Alphaproteobacteria bacterium]MBF0251868.1 hypothetical protein [Alphaproteobacteria bacterium]
MADISLTNAVRQSLLSLQSTTDMVERTQNRLSTGLKVSSATDDPVAFFQSKSLSDRAFDFTEKKDAIEQGVSALEAATSGLESVESLVRQLKGIANSMKAATGTQFTDLISQYNDIRSQVDLLTSDTTYQGINLINGTGPVLNVEFSDIAASKVVVNALDATAGGMGVNRLRNITAGSTMLAMNYDDLTAKTYTAGSTITMTFAGPDITLTTASSTMSVWYGIQQGLISGNVRVTAAGGSTTFVSGQTYTITLTTSGTAQSFSDNAFTMSVTNLSAGIAVGSELGLSYVRQGSTTTIDSTLTDLNSALTTLRSNASTLGNNIALLKTRLNFTQAYVNTLDTGSSKLTLADINEEGANLLALQTRQQLGVQALSFAGQAEQSILNLFG